MPEYLIPPLLGCSLALVLVTHKGFGSLLALVVIVALFSLRSEVLVQLRAQDRGFLLALNAYPLLVAFSMVLHGLNDPSLFENASRFALLSVVYIALRARPFNMGFIVFGAMLGCGLTFGASLLHLLDDSLTVEGSPGRFVGPHNAVVFAQIAFFLLLVAITPTRLVQLSASGQRLMLVTVVLLTSISLVVSQSRIVLLVFLVLCAYLLLFDLRLSCRRTTKWMVFALVICAGAYLLNTPYFYHLGGTTSELIANYGQVDQQTSLGQRLTLWSCSWQLLVEKPVFGHGIGQFNLALNNLPEAASLTDTVRAYSHAHNDFVQIAVEQGLAGLTVFLGAIAAIVIMALRGGVAADARHLLLGTICCWLLFALTQTQLDHQKTTMLFALLLALGFSHGMNGKYGPLLGSTP